MLNEPRQERSRETLRRILDATEALLEEFRLEEIPVSEIVRRADSSVGSFYARFSGKEALFVALVDRYHEDVLAEIAALATDPGWNRTSLRGRARRYVRRVIEHCRRRRGLLRLRLQRRLAAGDAVAESERNRCMVEAMSGLFRTCRKQVRHADPDRAIEFALRTVDGVATAAIALDDVTASFGTVDDQRLVDELSRTVVAYLTTRA